MSVVLYEFKAPYSRFVRAVTTAMVILMIFLSMFFLYLLIVVGDGIVILAPLPIVLALLIIPYLFSPRGYALTESGVLIRRPVGNILIPYNSIANVRIVTEKLRWGIRLWGSGGLYGFIGLFHIKNLGRVWMYVTDHSRMVLIETHKGIKYIISPDNPTAFIERLHSIS